MERATNSSLILYTTEDGLTKIEATFDRDTVWLSIDQMADLFQRNKSTISRHIGCLLYTSFAKLNGRYLSLTDGAFFR